MKNSCINLKIKLDKSLFCKKKNKKIFLKECTNCNFKKYKTQANNLIKNKTHIKKKMRVKTYKLAKLEKNRFSIIYQDLTKCCNCGLKTGDFDVRINQYTKVEKNEVFEGCYRQTSIKLGMIVPLCIFCHKQFHKDILGMNLAFKIQFQKEYMKTHSLEDFIKNFGQDYTYKLK